MQMSWKAAKTSALLCALFLVVYCTTNWLASLRPHVPSFPFSWERHIPFVPLMILPYLSIDLFFIASPFFCRDDLERRTLARRIAAAILIAGCCFLLFPLRFAFDRPPVQGWLGMIFDNFRAADQPFNQAPSLHIALGMILAVHYAKQFRARVTPSPGNAREVFSEPHDGGTDSPRGTGVPPVLATWNDSNRGYRELASVPRFQHRQDARATGKCLLQRSAHAAIWLWFALILLSAVLTYQHHVIDVITGFGLAIACFHFIADEPLRQPASVNIRAGTYYLAGALVLATGALISRPWTWLLFWPATSCLLIGVAYCGLGPGIYRKNHGRLPFTTQLLLAPILLGQRLSLAHYARQCQPWNRVTDHVWIGRKLSDAEARAAIAAGVTAVLDLTAEFSEPRAFRGLDYRNLPLLDLTAPLPAQLHDACAWISERAARGIVYVHCKAGYSRTAAVAGAWLIASGEAESPDQAIAMLRNARPTMVIRPEAEAAIRGFGILFPPINGAVQRTASSRAI